MTLDEKKSLDQIKKLSESMLDLVNIGKWESITDIEEKRQGLLDEFFLNPVSEEDSQYIAEIIQQVLQINNDITKILEQNKKQLVTEFRQFKSSQKATKAYLSNL
ncbi:MAG: flagellar protein FliT [Pseudomonadota bacterium]